VNSTALLRLGSTPFAPLTLFGESISVHPRQA
jgi:hypothetical protein